MTSIIFCMFACDMTTCFRDQATNSISSQICTCAKLFSSHDVNVSI